MRFGSAMWVSLVGSSIVAAGIGSSLGTTFPVEAKEDASKPAYFTEKVKPILEANCTRCHAGANHRGGYNMNTRETLLKGGRHEVAIVPGQLDASFLVKLVNHQGPADDPMPMPPPPKAKLADADIAVLETWIKAGAVTPADPLFVAPPPAPASPAQ